MAQRLIIFDCDGVLVDSEPIACATVAEELAALAIDITPEDVASRYIGISAPSMYEDLEKRFGIDITSREREHIDAVVQARLASEVNAIKGAGEAVRILSRSWRLCVASSGSLQRIEGSLRRASLWEAVGGRVFSASQVQHGKPAPDLFLLAAAQMSIPISRTVVVEDSTAGVEAANAAGMVCVGFTGGGHSGPVLGQSLLEQGARVIFSDMTALPDLVAQLAIGF